MLKVIAAFDEIDFGSVDDEEVGAFIAEEEMFVRAGDFFDVLQGNLFFLPGLLFGQTRAENLRLGLKINDEIGLQEVRA